MVQVEVEASILVCSMSMATVAPGKGLVVLSLPFSLYE